MSTQKPQPSWLDGGAEAAAMAKEDGLLPAAQHTSNPARVANDAERFIDTIMRGTTRDTRYTQAVMQEAAKHIRLLAAIAKATGSAA